MAGRKTSVYLSEQLSGAVEASGVPLPELIRRGLSAGEPEPLEAMLRRVLAELLGTEGARPAAGRVRRARTAQPEAGPGGEPGAAGCPHPSARVLKGMCGACGTWVGQAARTA